MSLGQKLINRLGAQARKVKRLAPSFENINLQTATLARAAGSQKLILSAQRQTDQSGIGQAVLAQKIEVAKVLALAAALADVGGTNQAQTVTAVADVAGSLNSTWFSLSSINGLTNARKDWYMWFDNGTGVDPAPVGKSPIHIVYTNNASATTLGGLMAAALAAHAQDWSSATNTAGAVHFVDAFPGPVPAAADGTAATGFGFAAPSPAGVLPTNLQATISNTNIGNNVEADLQIQAGDLMEVLSGQLIGQFFTIASITNNVIQLVEVSPGYHGESGISLRFEMRTTKPAFKMQPSEQL